MSHGEQMTPKECCDSLRDDLMLLAQFDFHTSLQISPVVSMIWCESPMEITEAHAYLFLYWVDLVKFDERNIGHRAMENTIYLKPLTKCIWLLIDETDSDEALINQISGFIAKYDLDRMLVKFHCSEVPALVAQFVQFSKGVIAKVVRVEHPGSKEEGDHNVH